MTIKQTVALCLISAGVAGAATHFFLPKIEVKTVDREVVRTDIKTITKTVTQPSGATETTTETIDHSVKSDVKSSTSVVVGPTMNISLLISNDFSQSRIEPIYGIFISKQFVGPITAGAFGLTNGIVGISVGINF